MKLARQLQFPPRFTLLIIMYDLFSGFQQLYYCWRFNSFGGEPDQNLNSGSRLFFLGGGGVLSRRWGNLAYRFIVSLPLEHSGAPVWHHPASSVAPSNPLKSGLFTDSSIFPVLPFFRWAPGFLSRLPEGVSVWIKYLCLQIRCVKTFELELLLRTFFVLKTFDLRPAPLPHLVQLKSKL